MRIKPIILLSITIMVVGGISIFIYLTGTQCSEWKTETIQKDLGNFTNYRWTPKFYAANWAKESCLNLGGNITVLTDDVGNIIEYQCVPPNETIKVCVK